jgi:chaperone required for assembly of F1-ATPase
VDWLKNAKGMDFSEAQALIKANPMSPEAVAAMLKLNMQLRDKWFAPLEPAMVRITSATERLMTQQSELEAERARILALGRGAKTPIDPAR